MIIMEYKGNKLINYNQVLFKNFVGKESEYGKNLVE